MAGDGDGDGDALAVEGTSPASSTPWPQPFDHRALHLAEARRLRQLKLDLGP